MSCRYSRVRIAADLFKEAPRFAPAGQAGDRFEMFISFEGDLPVPIPQFQTTPRLIITPVRTLARDGPTFNLVTPICAAHDISVKGFRLAVCNQDPDFGGIMAFNWVAIEESSNTSNPVPDVDTGTVPPMDFGPFRETSFGQRTFRDHNFGGSGLFDSSAASVQLSASDANVRGHSVAATGIVDNPEDQETRKAMTAHNVDVTGGECAFDWATFSLTKTFEPPSPNGAPELFVQTGEVPEAWFEPGGHRGDWHTWDVAFEAPFSEAPVVLLTATKSADIPVRLTAAAVPVVQAATANGFRLAARSCDLRPGLSSFNWIAIGHPRR